MSVLVAEDLQVRYGTGSHAFLAVDGVGFEIPEAASLGLVGESGSGKSTVARALVGLEPLQTGAIRVDGRVLTPRSRRDRKALRESVQLVFQDPYASLNPRMTAGELIGEAIRAHRTMARRSVSAEISRLLALVALDRRIADRYPHELSGGQRQRVAIGRALATQPRVLIADEITSALDVSVQATVLNVLRSLQLELGLSMLFISHDLAVVHHVCQTVAVMYCGQVVEMRPARELFRAPGHPYSRVLLDSLPGTDQSRGRTSRLDGEPSDAAHPPSGCRFHPRCPVGPNRHPAREVCAEADPAGVREAEQVACFFALNDRAGVVEPSRPYDA